MSHHLQTQTKKYVCVCFNAACLLAATRLHMKMTPDVCGCYKTCRATMQAELGSIAVFNNFHSPLHKQFLLVNGGKPFLSASSQFSLSPGYTISFISSSLVKTHDWRQRVHWSTRQHRLSDVYASLCILYSCQCEYSIRECLHVHETMCFTSSLNWLLSHMDLKLLLFSKSVIFIFNWGVREQINISYSGKSIVRQ